MLFDSLAPQEQVLLSILFRARVTVSREALIYAMWEAEGKDEPDYALNLIGIFVHRIRKKLGKESIITHWGHGYRIGRLPSPRLYRLPHPHTPPNFRKLTLTRLGVPL